MQPWAEICSRQLRWVVGLQELAHPPPLATGTVAHAQLVSLQRNDPLRLRT